MNFMKCACIHFLLPAQKVDQKTLPIQWFKEVAQLPKLIFSLEIPWSLRQAEWAVMPRQYPTSLSGTLFLVALAALIKELRATTNITGICNNPTSNVTRDTMRGIS